MELVMKKLLATIPKRQNLNSEKYLESYVLHEHYFHPFSNWNFFAAEIEPDQKEVSKEYLFYGWVQGIHPEWEYFNSAELKSIKIAELPIERDQHFTPITFSKLADWYKQPIPSERNQVARSIQNI